MAEKKAPPRVNVRYVFNVCNDIAAVRRFYVDLLGMSEVSFMDTPEFGWLSIKCEGFQMMWFRAGEVLPVPTQFTCQPGWPGGVLECTSWGIEVPEADFVDTLSRLTEAGVEMFKSVPEWRQDSYWGLSVLDPMGVTVEVYNAPARRPESTDWPSD